MLLCVAMIANSKLNAPGHASRVADRARKRFQTGEGGRMIDTIFVPAFIGFIAGWACAIVVNLIMEFLNDLR